MKRTLDINKGNENLRNEVLQTEEMIVNFDSQVSESRSSTSHQSEMNKKILNIGIKA